MKKPKYCIFTKPHHVEKLTNHLNTETNIDYIITSERYEIDAYDYDIGISYCYPWIIHVDKYPDRVFYNYHPAPLPKYKGLHVYEQALKDKVEEWAVSLHIMTSEVDSGELLARHSFPLKSIPAHTNELGCIGHYYLFQLFKETIFALQHKPKNMNEFVQAKSFNDLVPISEDE